MKKIPKLCLWLIPAALMHTATAAVSISGTTAYTQDFNTLPTAAARGEFDWTDNVTIPGFYLHRSNAPAGQTNLAGALTTAASRPYVSNGGAAASTAPVFHGFLSLGNFSSTDRALGFSPTTTDSATNWAGGTLSIIGVYTNTGTKSLDVTDITYELENWFANSTAGTQEVITFSYKTGNATTLLAELATASASATFTQAGYNPVGGGLFDLTSADGFATPAVPGSTERSGSLSPAIRVAPGESLFLRWGNVNDGGADAQVGIDNLFINFVEVSASVVPVVSNIVRHDMGTPTLASDDTVDFTLTVTGLGAVNPAGWKISSPFALSTETGTYGTAKVITGVPIAEFASVPHTVDVVVEDQGSPAVTATVPVTVPWGTITPVISNVTRDNKGTDSPFDDTWGYSVTVNAVFAGAGWTSNNSAYLNGLYGSTQTVTGLAMATTADTAIFTDSADSGITANFTVGAPLIIGKTNFGAEETLLVDSSGVPASWVVDETALTQKMDLGPGAPARVYRSRVIDLTSVGVVKFTGSVFVEDKSSGFEAGDTFNAQLIIDGTTTVSLITPYDTLTPADGILTGAEISPATAGPPPTTGGGTWTHTFAAVIPASANSVQLVISGNNDSDNEEMTVQNLLFELGAHSIIATPAGVQFDNKGTLTPDDDEYRQALTILGVNPPPGSTGWTSNLTPAAGLYADAQPVQFGPFLQTAGVQNLTLTDNGVPAVTTAVTITPPTPGIVATFVDGVVNRNNANDFSDDTSTLRFTVSAPVGSTAFRVDAHPLVTDSATYPLTATPTIITINLTGAWDAGVLNYIFIDASYPASRATVGITAPAAALTRMILGKKDLGAGVSNFLTLTGSALPVEWQNFNIPPAVMMNNGAGAPAKVLTSEVIDLSSVGDARFTATLHVRDISSGFEATDTFLAQLIYNGDTANPVNLITPYDNNPADGVLSGAELCAAPPVGVTHQDFEYALSANIPAAVNNVQLVITAVNDSASEFIYFENALFALATVLVDTDNDGIPDDYEDANGLDKNSNADKDLDLDGDGQSNLNEYLAGTAANDSASTLKITTALKNGSNATITWTSVPGKTYRVDVSPGLGPWTDLGSDFPAAAGPATTTTSTVALPGPLPAKSFLRVRVK